MALPGEVDAYVRELARRWGEAFDGGLVGLYVHGSAAMGGWTLPLSDVDVLAVIGRTATAEEKVSAAAVVLGPALVAPGAGLEFSVVTTASLATVSERPPFELHGSTGHGAKVIDGEGHPGDPDLVLHYAVSRERGVAVVGPPVSSVFPVVPRAMVIRGLVDELGWAREHAPVRYQVLNALRAWAYAETGRLLSKFEAVGWAEGRGRYVELARAAWRAQVGEVVEVDADEVAELLDEAAEAIGRAS